MKATLEFDLDDPHDAEQHRLAVNARRWYSVAWDLSNWLREVAKYGDLSEQESRVNKQVREKLFALMEQQQVSLDDLS